MTQQELLDGVLVRLRLNGSDQDTVDLISRYVDDAESDLESMGVKTHVSSTLLTDKYDGAFMSSVSYLVRKDYDDNIPSTNEQRLDNMINTLLLRQEEIHGV